MYQRERPSAICHRPSYFRNQGGKKDILRNRSQVATIPVPVAGAEWQAGVTEKNERLRVLLNGIPQPLAFAARASTVAKPGWVMVYLEPVSQQAADGGKAHRIQREVGAEIAGAGTNAGFQTLRGDVRIVPGE